MGGTSFFKLPQPCARWAFLCPRATSEVHQALCLPVLPSPITKRRTRHPFRGTTAKQHYDFRQNSKTGRGGIPQISEASNGVNSGHAAADGEQGLTKPAPVASYLAMPKSDTFTMRSALTKQFLAAWGK